MNSWYSRYFNSFPPVQRSSRAFDAQPAGCKSSYCEPPWCKNCGDKPRQMKLGDLYAYYNFGWHQFDWPVLPVEWYS